MPKLSEIEVSEETKLSTFKINVSDCIVLCEIIEDFEKFISNLKDFAKGIKGNMNLNHLYKHIVDGNKASKKVRDFYVENHKVLDTIHNYSYISSFLFLYYNSENGKFSREIMQMYEYIKNNIGDRDKILFVLYKLENLGFKVINFSENKNLDDIYEYNICDDYYYFVDGEIEIVPSLDGFKYKTTGANYQIEFCRVPFHNSIITLNNLVFDSCLLPKSLSYDNTLKKILELKKDKEESYKVLSDIVGLDYNLESIIPALEKIDEIIANIHNCKYNDSAKEHISKAKEAVYGLRTCLTNYQTDMVNQNLITEEILYKETKNEKRKSNNYIIIK